MSSRFGLMRQASEWGWTQRERGTLDNRVSSGDISSMINEAKSRIACNEDILNKEKAYMSEKQKASYERCIKNDRQLVDKLTERCGR